MATPAEAGFAPDLEDRFEIARHAGILPNLHGVVAARDGRIFFERYLAGPDAARAAVGRDPLRAGHAARHALGHQEHRRGQVAAATASISIKNSSPNNVDTSTRVIAGAAGGVVVAKNRSLAFR